MQKLIYQLFNKIIKGRYPRGPRISKLRRLSSQGYKVTQQGVKSTRGRKIKTMKGKI